MKHLLALLFITFAISTYAQHSVILKSGDKVKGIVMEIKLDTLHLFVNREMRKYPLVEIKSIFFNEYVPYDGSFTDDEPIKTMKSGKYLIKYQMKDRKMTTPPTISNGTENRGIVVVDVTIDRYGIVKTVKAGASGSTTSNHYLYIKAEFAAKGARFSSTKTGPLSTKGTIIIAY